MRYVVLLVDYVDPERDWSTLSEHEQTAELGRHAAFGDAVAAREGCEIVLGEALAPGEAATVVRPSATGAPTVADGPFAEATEGIGGLYVLEAPDLDAVIELVSIMSDYVMEVRPVDDSVG